MISTRNGRLNIHQSGVNIGPCQYEISPKKQNSPRRMANEIKLEITTETGTVKRGK